MDSIGRRAADAVRQMARSKGILIAQELEMLGIGYGGYQRWYQKNASPGGYVLANMLRRGYDLDFILLGKENNYVKD